MPVNFDPPKTGGAVSPKPSRSTESVKGKTSNARSVEKVDVEPYHSDLEPPDEGSSLSERDIRGHQATPILPDEEDDEFEDALDYFYQEPPSSTATETTGVVEVQKTTPIPKGNLIERFFAVLMVWAMDLTKVKNKLSLDTGAAVHQTKAKIADVRHQEKVAKKTGNKLTRQQSQQELKTLKQDKKQAKSARNSEFVGYLKLLRALKQIHQKIIDRHNVHLTGMTLGGGRVALKDVDLSVSKVDLVQGQDGHSVPQITADINGFVEIPLPDKPPLRVRLEMTDVRVTAEGRLAPIAKTIIGKRSLPEIVQQLAGVRKGKGKLFALSRFGIEAGCIKMTLENPDSETLASLVTRARSTRGRSIDKIFTSLGLPLEFKTDELELMVAPRPGEATPAPLVSAKRLHVHYHPPASLVQLDTDPSETRELGISAGSLDVNTQGVSTAIGDTIQQLTPELMELMPGESIPQPQWLEQLQGQSTSFTAHVEDFDLSLGREVVRKDGKVELTGGDQLRLRTGPLEIHNKGRATLDIEAKQLHVSGSKEGVDKTYALDASDYKVKADLKQPLPKDKGSVDVHGVFSGEQLLVAGFTGKDNVEAQVVLKKSQIKTNHQASSLKFGTTRIDLPDDLEGTVENIQATHRREHDKREAGILVEQTDLTGEGQLKLKTEKHQLTVPVHGHVSNSKTTIQWQAQKEGSFGQRHSDLKVNPGKLTLENIKIDHAHIGEAGFDIDDHMTGKVVLQDIEADLEQMLGENSFLSYGVQEYIPEAALKGRKIKLSLEVPVDKGELIFPKFKVLECTLDSAEADEETWTGWGVTKALNVTGYLKNLMGGYSSISIEDVHVSDGRLWIQPRFSLSAVGSVKPWIPLFRISGYDVKSDTGVMLPELLHKYTGAHFTELNAEEMDLIRRVNSGTPDTPKELEQYCRKAGQDKSSHILKAININPWLELAEKGDDRARLMLASLLPIFREFPVSAGKALSIHLLTGWPVTPEDVEFFCEESAAKHLAPSALAELVSRAKDFDRARTILTEASEKLPTNADLYWHEYNVIEKQIHASAQKENAADIIEKLRKEQIMVLRKAARLGHPKAITELNLVAERGNPVAKLACAGMALTKEKTATAFYPAIQHLEQVSQSSSPDLADTAREILIRRARNSRMVFIHALPEQDELLARQIRLINSGKEMQLTADELYLWGLRYLYGIEGIKPDTAEAIKLLQPARSKGFRRAEPHIEVINRLQEV